MVFAYLTDYQNMNEEQKFQIFFYFIWLNPAAVIYNIQMSSHRTMTLSMQSLKNLYSQFFDRFVLPNLSKQLNQITQLLKQKTAYETHRYLQDTLATSADNYSVHTNSSLNSQAGSLNNLSSANPNNNYAYQYALPSQIDHPRSLSSENSYAFDRISEKQVQDPISFKNKLGVRRVQTGLPYEDQHKPYEAYQYKHIIDDNLMTIPSTSSNKIGAQAFLNIPNLNNETSSDLQINFALNRQPSENKKSRIMQEQVRKISKIFNQGHSKIEKYCRNGNEAQKKLFNLNTSLKLQKREQGVQIKPSYPQKQQTFRWKF